jgi:hypothetical protein
MPDWPWTEVAGTSTLVVALAALGVAIWQGWVQRKHARLSVKPVLDTYSRDVLESPSEEIGVWIKNTGLGPGRATEIRVFVDGIRLPPMEKYADYRDALKQHGVYATNHVVQKGAILPAGESWGLFTVRLDSFPKENWPLVHRQFLEGLYRLAIEVDYESLYGESGDTERMDMSERRRPIRPLPNSWLT